MSDFGLRIGVEGEKEFKNALRDINRSFKVLGSEMALVSAQFDKNDKSIQALAARKEVLGKEVDAQSKKVDKLRSALKNAAASFGENDRRTQEWQIQLNRAQAELLGMERELGDTNKALDQSGQKFDEAEKQADQFGDELGKTGQDADNAGAKFGKLGGMLKGVSVAMTGAFVAIGASAAGAAKKLSAMTVGASQYADEMLTMTTVTGLSTDNLQAYKYAAGLVDVSLEALTGSMARNIKSMSAARGGTGATAGAYKALGVAVVDAQGNLRDSETVYWEVIDALGEVSNETERNALSMQLFGRSAQDLNPLIAAGSAGIAELTTEAREMGAVMGKGSLQALGTFNDAVERLKSGSAAAQNALGLVLLPQLQVLADDGVQLLGQFTRGLHEAGGDWGKIREVVGGTVSGIVNTIMQVIPDFIQLGMDVVMSIGGAIMDYLPKLVDAASQVVLTLLQGMIRALPGLTEGALQLVLALVNGIIANLPEIAGAAVQMISTLIAGLSKALPQLIPAIVQAVVLVKKTLLDNLPLLLSAALQIVLGLVEGILTAVPQLIAALPVVITAIVTFLVNNIPLIVDAGIQLFTALVAALPEIISAIVAAVPLIITGLTTAILGSLPQMAAAGFRLLAGLMQNLPGIVATVVLAVPQIIAGLISAFNSAIGQMSQIGGALIRGLWQGISDMGAWIRGQIAVFMNGIVGGIKSFFGIRSPSLLFAGIGGDMAAGIGVGFERAMSQVGDEMRRAIPTDFEVAASTAPSAPGATPAVGSQGPLFIVQSMVVRSEADIESISRQLYRHIQVGMRGRGEA